MATKTYYFSGTVMYPKLVTPDTKFNKEGIYTLDLFMDDDSWEKFERSGAQLKVRDRDGAKFVTFKRPARKMIKADIVEMGPPDVLQADNTPFDMTKLVGNGSKVTVKVNVYDTMKGKGHTLEAVRVDELHEYVREAPDHGEAF